MPVTGDVLRVIYNARYSGNILSPHEFVSGFGQDLVDRAINLAKCLTISVSDGTFNNPLRTEEKCSACHVDQCENRLSPISVPSLSLIHI